MVYTIGMEIKGVQTMETIKLQRDMILDIIKRGRNGNEMIIIIDSLIKSEYV